MMLFWDMCEACTKHVSKHVSTGNYVFFRFKHVLKRLKHVSSVTCFIWKHVTLRHVLSWVQNMFKFMRHVSKNGTSKLWSNIETLNVSSKFRQHSFDLQTPCWINFFNATQFHIDITLIQCWKRLCAAMLI